MFSIIMLLAMGSITATDPITQTATTEKLDFEIWAGFGIPIVSFGALSNAFFFISVVLAMKNSRLGFGEEKEEKKWQWMCLLNLSAVDFFYCTNYFINGMIGLAQLERDTIPALCKFIVLSRSNLAAIDGWCIAAFAINFAFGNFGYVPDV